MCVCVCVCVCGVYEWNTRETTIPVWLRKKRLL